jgi:hypothetical protein
MKFNEIKTEEKVRLDPKCWTGKKIGNPKTKVKGGVRVNNCVPAESVAEDQEKRGRGRPPGRADAWDTTSGKVGRTEKTATGVRHHADPSRYGGTEAEPELNKLDKGQVSKMDNALGVKWDRESNQYFSPIKVDEEGYNPEYNDEAGMADNNLETLERAVAGIDDLIQAGDNLPEWCQEKIAVAKSMLVAVWDYMESEEDSEEVDPEVDEMFEAMDQLAEEIAAKNGVSADLVWESFEALPDNMLYETAAWRRKEGKSAKGGLNAKGVASYRRENPGSKLQTAVTTKPSKLKPGSKAAKRRKSFCARMGGVKGPMKKPNGKPTRKALALRKWNC